MKNYRKRDFPPEDIRQLLEPGPIVLVTSHHKGDTNIMTMGWHTVMEFSPSLIGCVIASSNHSFDLIKASKVCGINIPTFDMVDTVIKIGNSNGSEIDKFATFGLTPQKASKIDVPLIKECYANIECKLYDKRLVNTYNFFIFEVIKAHVATTPRTPTTIHYHGQGRISPSGRISDKSRLFTKWKQSETF